MNGRVMEIPRGTCRLFGAIKASATLKNSAVLVHGPKGCVYHINYILGLRGDRHSPLFSTCLDENDVVFGAEEKLRCAIEDLDALRSPEILVVLSCCASSIIGEDVQSAVREARTNSLVIGIEAGGFEDEYTEGYRETLRRIAEETAVSTGPVRPRTVNLIGLLRGGPDLREIRRLLSLLDVSVIAVLTAGGELKDLRRMGTASLNLVLCETSGLGAAQYLKERFHTPFISLEFPVGSELSRTFLTRVAEALDIPDGGRLSDIPKEVSAPGQEIRIALVSGPTRAVAVSRFLAGLGMPPRLVVLDFDSEYEEKVRDAAGPDCEVLVSPDWDKILDRLDRYDINVLIGGMMERPLTAGRDIRLIDIMHGSLATAGPEGGRNILRLILGD